MRKKEKIFLLLILIFAFFLRFYRVSNNPPSLNWDEVSHSYNAYSILKTGEDEWGVRFPSIFRAYGDYKLPLYIYLTTIPVKILGLTPLAVRLISVLAGLGLVWVAYLIGGWLAAFLTAVSPWSLFLSRIAVEANLAAFLVALGGWAIMKERFLLTAILWGLSLHTYNSARVLVALLALFVGLRLMRKKNWKRLVLFGGILILFYLPVVAQLFSHQAAARFFWVSLIDQGTINRIIENRLDSNLPPFLARLIHNRVTYFLAYSFRNYWRHFSPLFLFSKGGSHYQFSMPDFGILYLVTAPFLLIGLIMVRNWFFLFWFLAAFLPAAITRDSPHVLRSILVLPLPMVLTSLGVEKVVDWLKEKSKFGGKLVMGIFIFSVLVSFLVWWRGYWQGYRIGYSWAWQYGYQEVIDYTKAHYDEYDKILVTKKYGEPHEFFLFYWPWDPEKYRNDPNLVRYFRSNWYWVDRFDKFEFINDWEVKNVKCQMSNVKCLLITSPGNYPEGWRKLEVVNFLDGKPAFEILEQ